MDLVEEAFSRLYPERVFGYSADVKYSRKFKPYNARVQWRGRHIQLRLSATWKEVDAEITLGLVQVLLLRMLREQKSTFNIELYHSFIKKLPDVTPKGESDPLLEQSFARVNENYFFGMLESPTLRWGGASTSKLAHYDLHTNTIVVSTVFRDAQQQLLDYVMYHEMLHKKHQFVAHGKNSRFHTAAFRKDEKQFDGAEQLEGELKHFLRGQKRAVMFPRIFRRFF